jgi:hypothetical protein
MKNTNNNFNKSAKNTDYVFGGLAVFGALSAPGIFFLAALIVGAAEDDMATFGRVFLGGALFTVIWGILGIRAFVRASRSENYSKIFGAYPRMKLAYVVSKMNRPLRNVSADLSVLKRRGYFGEMLFDLDGKEVIFDVGSAPLPEVEGDAKTVYKESRGWDIWSFLGAFATLFPFMQLSNIPLFIFGVLAAVGTSLLIRSFFPAPVYFTEVKRTAPKVKRPLITGYGDLDSMLSAIYENKCEIVRLSESIASAKIRSPLASILQTLDQITEYVTENPDKAKNLRQFTNYYLPTTVDLLKNYEELEAKPDSLKGQNIKEAMTKIEGVTMNMTNVFRQEYDDLFADRVMDISAEIGVMQTIINDSKDM